MSLLKKFFIPILLMVLLFPLLRDYFVPLTRRDYYRLYPFLMVTIGIIFFFRWRSAPDAKDRPQRWCTWLALCGVLLIMAAGLLYYAPYLAVIAWVLAMGAVAMELSGYRRVPNLFGIWCLLLLFIRIPHQLDLRLMNWLEITSARSASVILDYHGVMHVVQASVFALPEREFILVDICHGPVSWVSTLATAAVICVLRNRRLLHTTLLLMGSLLITWLLNVVKIITVVSVYLRYDIDILMGSWAWAYSGVFFFLALGLILSNDALLFFFLRKTIDEPGEVRVPNLKKATVYDKIWNFISGIQVSNVLAKFRSDRPVLESKKFSLPKIILVFLILPLIALETVVVYYKHIPKGESSMLMHSDDELIVLNKSSVRFDRPGWSVVNYKEEKRDFSSIWGMYSKVWTLNLDQTTVTLALDYPFHEWHDVKSCYRKLGWKEYGEDVLSDSPMFDWGASQTKFKLPSGDYGFVLCSHCDQRGGTVEPKPAEHKLNMVLYRLSPKKWTAPFGKSLNKDSRTFYQTQAMVTTNGELSEAAMEEVRAMYADFREQIRKDLQEASAK